MALRWVRPLVAGVVGLGVVTSFAQMPVPTGGTGAINFGVAPYGAPVPGVPTWAVNNFTGLPHVLRSPGGTFLTANPSVANNIGAGAQGPLPGSLLQIGGFNAFGNFGVGSATVAETSINFSLQDSNPPGSGAASYGIASTIVDFDAPVGGYVGTYGTYLAIAGAVPFSGNTAVAALRTRFTSNDPTSPFFGGVEMPPLVLALSRVSPGVTFADYSFVALGGAAGTNAVMVFNSVTGAYSGLAINNLGVINIPDGTSFTATSTLTFYADPATIGLSTDFGDLIAATGTTLPAFVAIPEPSAYAAVLGLAVLALALRRRR